MPLTRPLFALALVLAGCESYSVEDYWRELAAAHCQRMHTCCTPFEYNDWWTGVNGTQDCQQVWQSPPNAYEISRSIDDDRIAFDPAAAHACIAALAEVACADFEPAVRYRETYCESPLRGRLRDGDACRIDEECASGWCLVETQGGETVRRCTPPIPHGGACRFLGPGCERPEACQRDRTCGLGLPPGARCRSDSECIDHWCQGTTLFSDGTCIRACDGY